MLKNWFGYLPSSSRQPQSSDEITRMPIDDEEEGGKMDRILVTCGCIICFNPWTREGDNQICSLSRCGHLFCASCIGKWIAKCSTGDSAKCPTCWKEFDLSDVTMLYGCPVVVIDEELRRVNFFLPAS
ncbi:hypothetical protein LWI28_005916 [Acer negundo]|uniref:RING-type domain-containing protein n=1 Tax=Acer negundo TaxID=4023 RepID=A0AAD5I9H4_ACENE|nr:hypothetical protein LWI28_005916 [Acer negundo]